MMIIYFSFNHYHNQDAKLIYISLLSTITANKKHLINTY